MTYHTSHRPEGTYGWKKFSTNEKTKQEILNWKREMVWDFFEEGIEKLVGTTQYYLHTCIHILNYEKNLVLLLSGHISYIHILYLNHIYSIIIYYNLILHIYYLTMLRVVYNIQLYQQENQLTKSLFGLSYHFFETVHGYFKNSDVYCLKNLSYQNRNLNLWYWAMVIFYKLSKISWEYSL